LLPLNLGKMQPDKHSSVHMFITRLKDIPLDGTAPALQYGYGGFSLAMLPTFSLSILLFCKIYRAVYALPNIRYFSPSIYVFAMGSDVMIHGQ
jgi:hypothetical protein